jgi:hypothetical protein
MNGPAEKLTVEKLIQAVERAYSDLRQKNPDRDEHWLLANTWLSRYGSSQEAREKGAEWARFNAYKDTVEFSLLNSPESVRVLALYLAFKELGEEPLKNYEREFFRLMEPVVKSKENRTFLEDYRQKNPFTWQEVRVEDNSPYSLYWFLRGVELEQEREPEPEDEFGEVDLIDILSNMDKEELSDD